MENVIIRNNNGRSDGREFVLQSKLFMQWLGTDSVHIHDIPNNVGKAGRRAATLRFLRGIETNSVRNIAFFCHGVRREIEPGFDVGNVDRLGVELKRIAKNDAVIALYCCLAGHDDDGLAAMLHAACGLPLMAHASSSPYSVIGGHTTRNPGKRRWIGGSPQQMWPSDAAARKAWQAALRSDPMRPFELIEMVRAEAAK